MATRPQAQSEWGFLGGCTARGASVRGARKSRLNKGGALGKSAIGAHLACAATADVPVVGCSTPARARRCRMRVVATAPSQLEVDVTADACAAREARKWPGRARRAAEVASCAVRRLTSLLRLWRGQPGPKASAAHFGAVMFDVQTRNARERRHPFLRPLRKSLPSPGFPRRLEPSSGGFRNG